MRFPLLCLFVVALLLDSARAAEPFFKKNDVIALVGGEDMVVASECGYLELLLVRALPDYHLRFRNLAWEGDTVFEQHRDLNFPSWEEALDKIGATVVICQFGQMESLDGKEKLPEFIAAYEKLLDRLSGQRESAASSSLPTDRLQSADRLTNHGTRSKRLMRGPQGIADMANAWTSRSGPILSKLLPALRMHPISHRGCRAFSPRRSSCCKVCEGGRFGWLAPLCDSV